MEIENGEHAPNIDREIDTRWGQIQVSEDEGRIQIYFQGFETERYTLADSTFVFDEETCEISLYQDGGFEHGFPEGSVYILNWSDRFTLETVQEFVIDILNQTLLSSSEDMYSELMQYLILEKLRGSNLILDSSDIEN